MLLSCKDVKVELKDLSFLETSLTPIELFEFLLLALVRFYLFKFE